MNNSFYLISKTEKNKCQNCKDRPSNYNFPNEKRGIFCSNCKIEGMVHFYSKKCERCKIKQPNYNFPDQKTATFCFSCKTDGMVDIKSKKCQGCNLKRPLFNFPDKPPNYCYNCKSDDMINVTTKKCQKCNLRQCYYNFPNETKPLYCSNCKTEDMINVTYTKKCQKCKLKQPNFNFPNESKALFCSNCKIDGMINIKSKKCQKCNLKAPYFNFPNETVAVFCNDCKIDGMTNIRSTKCENCNTKRAIYNYPNETKGLLCYDCKKPNMVNIFGKRCQECKLKWPSFNYPHYNESLFCYDCKKIGMVDVRSKKCEDCDKRATFGYFFRTIRWCTKHKKAGCVPANQIHPKCQLCTDKAYYQHPKNDDFPKRCEKHKEEDDINISEKPCKKCGLKYFLREDVELCPNCYLFFEKKTNKVKEEKLKTWISNSKFQKYWIGYDQKINGCFSNRRPDFLFKFPLFYVILEVDEGQHRSYACECDVIRMAELHGDLKGEPLVFIRYNPDAFKDYQGKPGKVSDNFRLKQLESLLQGLLNRTEWTEQALVVYYLFYDGYNPNQLEKFTWDYFQDILKTYYEPNSIDKETESNQKEQQNSAKKRSRSEEKEDETQRMIPKFRKEDNVLIIDFDD